MATAKLTMDTICGGDAVLDLQAAIRRVYGSFDDERISKTALGVPR